MIKKNKKNIIPLLFLFPIAFILMIDNFYLQSAVDGALILNGDLKFPNQTSNVLSVHFNSWTIINHLTLLLVKTKINVFIISKILLYISTISFSFGIFLISTQITKNLFLSIFIVCFTMIGKINFGNVDYPALLYSEHTYGMFSLSFFTLFVGLLFNRNFKLAGFTLLLLFSIHVVIGAWIISLCFFIILYFNFTIDNKDDFNNYFTKNFLKGMFVGLFPTILSFIQYKKNMVEKNNYSDENYQTFIDIWDHHRNLIDINYIYIFLTLTLILIFFIYSKKKYNEKNIFEKFLLYLIVLHCIGSLLIYLTYKFFPQYFPDIFIRAMVSRLFLIHTHIGYPLIISFLYCLFENKFNFSNNKNNFIKFISILIIFSSLSLIYRYETRHHISNRDFKSKIIYRINKFKINFSNTLNFENQKFWEKVNNLNTSGFFVTTINTSEPTLRFGRKPYIINAEYFDLVPYHPYTVDEVKNILEKIYNINFFNPPQKFTPLIPDQWIIEVFENRSKEQWSSLSKQFNLSGVIVPSDWKINIDKKITSKNYTLYKLQ